ncbi:Serine/threonine-protein kinase HT1 [Tetrabaena socialis]|uniref:Serine/threonine-protein kinase HT1 n=1 Tax=Tetrabaena socialis TaxID=47790 RepID=A0A2J8A9C4_9CHLO|nr:Serine/threonine-protein kinase HT1 [Tetrabaena socialis]|eukprot:PNH09132.1 Serine/threonine-protein kinase HT1 [Tetrabaena socialis]
MEVISERPDEGLDLKTLRLSKTLGRGGFAIVYAGTLKGANGAPVNVAVKVLHEHFSADGSEELRLFLEEASLMLQMSHRNVITAYALLKLPPSFPGLSGYTQPAYALVLEVMEGGSLAGLMIKQLLAGSVSKYSFSQALGWCLDVARALQYLHAGGRDGAPRIHRDVKLENVLLTDGMRTAKLADFGLQRPRGVKGCGSGAMKGVGGELGMVGGSATARRTASVSGVGGRLSGTGKKKAAAEYEEVFSLTGRTGSMVYLAPEAYKNEPYNDKVDIYSLAILMYELFGRTSVTYTHISTKLPAFSRMLINADEFAERVAAGYRPPRPKMMNKLPPELWELIEAAWHQDPVRRPDIDEVVEQLEAVAELMAEAEAEGGGKGGKAPGAGCGCVVS